MMIGSLMAKTVKIDVGPISRVPLLHVKLVLSFKLPSMFELKNLKTSET